MVAIQQVNYYDRQTAMIDLLPHNEIALVIKHELKNTISNYSFVLNYDKGLSFVDEDNSFEVLEILFSSTEYCKKDYRFSTLLNITQEMIHISNALFVFYASSSDNPVDLLIAYLIEQILKANSDRLFENKAFHSLILYMNENISKPLKNDDLCHHVHMIPRTLRRLCHRNMEMTPMALLRQLRINEGKKLLETTTISIQVIAREVGFTSQKQFSAVFKKLVGKTPTEVRREAFVLRIQ